MAKNLKKYLPGRSVYIGTIFKNFKAFKVHQIVVCIQQTIVPCTIRYHASLHCSSQILAGKQWRKPPSKGTQHKHMNYCATHRKKVYFAGQATKDYYYLIHSLLLANTSRRIRNQAFLTAPGKDATLLMGSGFLSKGPTLPKKAMVKNGGL